jgi:hypothetical protein
MSVRNRKKCIFKLLIISRSKGLKKTDKKNNLK